MQQRKSPSAVRKILLTAGLSALPVIGLGASHVAAQVRVGEDGRAADANTRVGSAGLNSSNIPPAYINNMSNPNLGNKIVTGNVTGFSYFRGGVPYRDQNEFRGTVAGEDVDRFIARSSGVPQTYQPNPSTIPGQPQPFYGRSLAAPAALPQGFQAQGSSGTYTAPAPTAPTRDTRIDASLSALRPNDFVMPGPVDVQTGQPSSVVSASPLLGLRSFNVASAPDRTFLANYSAMRQESALARLHLDPRTLEAMRQELSDALGTGAQQGANPADRDVPPNQGTSVRPNPNAISGATVKPFETPENPNLAGQTLPGAADTVGGQPLPGDVRPDGGVGRRMSATPARRPAAAQYQELERRLQRYYTDQLQTDEQRNQEFLRQLRQAEQKRDNPAAPGTPTPAPAPGPGASTNTRPDYEKMSHAITGGAATRPVTGSARPEPLKIDTLTQAVQGQGLAKLVKAGEDLMRQGKFADALAQFEAANQVARDNGLVMLGQANAELGVGYYQRTEGHLRQALSGDPVLSMAQFDLKQTIGQVRLEKIVTDLKEAARKDEKDPGAPLLLAYVAYNTGNEAQARIFLDLADQRAGSKDELIKVLRTHWKLPEGPATRPAVPDNK